MHGLFLAAGRSFHFGFKLSYIRAPRLLVNRLEAEFPSMASSTKAFVFCNASFFLCWSLRDLTPATLQNATPSSLSAIWRDSNPRR